jgi:hypothetical protein
MKKAILACTCALLQSTGSVFAQMQPSSSGNVGPGTNNNAGPQPGGK